MKKEKYPSTRVTHTDLRVSTLCSLTALSLFVTSSKILGILSKSCSLQVL